MSSRLDFQKGCYILPYSLTEILQFLILTSYWKVSNEFSVNFPSQTIQQSTFQDTFHANISCTASSLWRIKCLRILNIMSQAGFLVQNMNLAYFLGYDNHCVLLPTAFPFSKCYFDGSFAGAVAVPFDVHWSQGWLACVSL